MGLFSNPLGHAGYPADSTTAQVLNSTVRAATQAEVQAGTVKNAYVAPATLATGGGAGSFTTLTSSGNTTLATGAAVTSATLANGVNTGSLTVQIANGASGANAEVDILSGVGTAGAGTLKLANNPRVTTINLANVAPSAARTTTMFGGNAAQNDTVTVFGGNPSANTQSFTVFGGAPSGGTQTVGIFSGTATGGTQTFNLLTGTFAGTANIGTGAATAHVLNLGNASATIGFFGKSAAIQQTQAALTNNVTAGGVTGTIANYTDLTVYANDAADIRNDIYQLALALSSVITALRAYGLLK